MNNEFEEAIVVFSAYIQKNPGVISAYLNRAQVYVESKEYDKAIIDYNHAIEIDPQNDACYRSRGIAYLDMEKYEKAIPDLERAIELRTSYENIFSFGRAYYQMGQYDKAIECYNKVIDMNSHKSDGYAGRGWAYVGKCQFERAISDYSIAITLGDKFIHFPRSLGHNSVLGI